MSEIEAQELRDEDIRNFSLIKEISETVSIVSKGDFEDSRLESASCTKRRDEEN